MAEKKLVLVIGITGNQGHSVAEALISDGSFRVRGISRNVQSRRAKELKEKGVEMVHANVHYPEDMKKAFRECYAAFAVTNFWDPSIGIKEEQIGKQMARIAKEEGVKHYIWSTVPDAEERSKGKYKALHFTCKAKVDPVVKDLNFQYHTFVSPSSYYQNFVANALPVGIRERGNEATFIIPIKEDAVLSAFDVNDLGKVVLQVLKRPEEFNGKYIPVVGDTLSMKEYVQIYSEVKQKKTDIKKLLPDQLAKTSNELAQMYGYIQDFGYYGDDVDIELGKKVCPQLASWRDWIGRIPEEKFQSE